MTLEDACADLPTVTWSEVDDDEFASHGARALSGKGAWTWLVVRFPTGVIGFGYEDLPRYWTPEMLRRVRDLLNDDGLDGHTTACGETDCADGCPHAEFGGGGTG